MLNNNNGSKCGFEDVMVSYIYDEIATAERRKFESHLVDCSVCTEEFASISNARFLVFEWQKEEFAHLSTPEIAIPYEPIIDEQASMGFLAGLRSLFSGYGMPVAVAASLLLVLGVGFAAISFLGRGEQNIAANIKLESPTASVGTGDNTRGPEAPSLPDNRPATVVSTPSAEIVPVKAVENRRPARASSPVPVKATRQSAQQARKAPVLSDYDDEDDRSLRLSDLFDGEIGGIR